MIDRFTICFKNQRSIRLQGDLDYSVEAMFSLLPWTQLNIKVLCCPMFNVHPWAKRSLRNEWTTNPIWSDLWPLPNHRLERCFPEWKQTNPLDQSEENVSKLRSIHTFTFVYLKLFVTFSLRLLDMWTKNRKKVPVKQQYNKQVHMIWLQRIWCTHWKNLSTIYTSEQQRWYCTRSTSRQSNDLH